jgi:hypothetical protein
MAIIIRRTWSRWSVQQRIFAVLLVALADTAIAARISVSLAPARISFSVANATTSRIPVLELVLNHSRSRTDARWKTMNIRHAGFGDKRPGRAYGLYVGFYSIEMDSNNGYTGITWTLIDPE